MRFSDSSTFWFPPIVPLAVTVCGVISPVRFAPLVFLSSIFPSFAERFVALQCDSERTKMPERRSNLYVPSAFLTTLP